MTPEEMPAFAYFSPERGSGESWQWFWLLDAYQAKEEGGEQKRQTIEKYRDRRCKYLDQQASQGWTGDLSQRFAGAQFAIALHKSSCGEECGQKCTIGHLEKDAKRAGQHRDDIDIFDTEPSQQGSQRYQKQEQRA